MASSGKFDLSSSSPDRPLYTNGQQRASFITGFSMERSGSFRENMENPILSSLPSMSRSTSTVITQGDVTNFLQCLRFDPKSMAAEYKFNRFGEFKRLASGALGVLDDSAAGSIKGKTNSSSNEDLKRLRAGLRESAIKARERVKIFSESLSVVNKCFPSIPSRKRSRPDALSGDRANGLLTDRAVMGVGKMGTQNHVPNSVFDFEPQKVEERGKNTIPNKRTRTSMMDQRADARPNTPARSTASVDRDKEVLRPSSSNGLQGDDRALPIVSDGWEKTKMKKRRSVIKADAASSPSSVSTKLIDGYREPKQGIHPRHPTDARSRLTDSYGFRPGAANGVVGAGKADGTSQQASMVGRSSIPKPEQESGSIHDKRERLNGSDKERTNNRAVNKPAIREEFISGSPTSTKLQGNARGPRSGTGTGVMPKLPPGVQRATASNDWDPPHGTNKNPGPVGPTNRKRTLSTRSSSPPVTQWADRRPQKISRTARRTNLVPVISNNEEIPSLDSSDVTGSENGPGFSRRFQNSPRPAKSKGDHLLTSGLSESEESGASEFRFRDKGKKFGGVEDKGGQNVSKMSTAVLPIRKNKLANGEDYGDGIRRQGRTGGRGFGSAARVVNQTAAEKRGSMGTGKQVRTARLSFDKSESRPGRPPTRKLADRKAYSRQKLTEVNVTTDPLVGSVEGQKELLAAESAVVNFSQSLSSPFWRQMEPVFALSDTDISFLNQQGNIQSTDSSIKLSNGPRMAEPEKNGKNRNIEVNPEPLLPETSNPGGTGTTLCQRLLSALISEEEIEDPTCSGNDDLQFNVYGSDVESKAFSHPALQNSELNGHDAFSVYGKNSTPRSYNHDKTSSTTCSEYDYANMSMDDRLLLEMHSIGIYPEIVPGLANTSDEDIGEDIHDLEKKHHEQVFRKKSLLDKLLKSATEARELQEKEFEQHSLDKLIGMAYQKYMSCWGPNTPGGKNASSKVAKQSALAFVKRTLDQCQEFETTGKSCFTEPLFREIFISGSSSSSHFNDELLVAVNDVESGQIYGNSIERASGTQQSPSLTLSNHDIYSSINHSSDQTIGNNEIWSSRVKKKELYLDDVIAGTSTGTPTKASSNPNGPKGKKNDKDPEWKTNGSFKVGRPTSNNAKGERKTKTKLKQKTTQLSGISDHHKPTASLVPKSVEINTKENGKYLEEDPLDFSHLELPEMDILGVGDDFGEQGGDLGSWLNIDEEVLQDDDFMGLEIPMDDLSELNMMV